MTRCKAFTLAELLIVLGVIGILLGLLLPVVSRVRARAIQAGCAANLAQVYHALQLYRGDFNDYLPRAASGSDYDWSPHFGAAVARYSVAERPLTWERVSKVGILHCRTSSFQTASTTYIINALSFDGDAPFLAPRHANRWRQMTVALDRLPLLMDSPPQGLGHCPETATLSAAYEDGIYSELLQCLDRPEHLNPAARCNRAGHDAHGRNRANILFAGGAVEAINLSSLRLADFDDGIRS